jgi:hypothetical protein
MTLTLGVIKALCARLYGFKICLVFENQSRFIDLESTLVKSLLL